MIWAGVCGFGRRARAIVRTLDAVEIQEAFYRSVSVARAAKWRSLASTDFRFAVKASRFITHEATSPMYQRSSHTIRGEDRSSYGRFQATAAVERGWEATRAIAEVLDAKVIVFEAPASFGPSEANRTALYRFFESIQTTAVKAIELRGPWATHVVERICEDLGLVHAVDPFEKEPATYGLAYFRLHGSPPGPAMYSYTHADLAKLKSICEEYDDAWVMFNNQSAYADALRFSERFGDAVSVGES